MKKQKKRILLYRGRFGEGFTCLYETEDNDSAKAIKHAAQEAELVNVNTNNFVAATKVAARTVMRHSSNHDNDRKFGEFHQEQSQSNSLDYVEAVDPSSYLSQLNRPSIEVPNEP
jgi:hypothetical protein